MVDLPSHSNIDIQALSQIFKHTTNSYKYLFFQAILVLLKREFFKVNKFSFEMLEKEMLELAKYPVNVFKLNFGTQDEVTHRLNGKDISLVKYVPYRLIASFYTEELRGIKDGAKNKEIEKLSNQVSESICLYQIQNKTIIIPSEWMAYLTDHYSVIESWCFWHWVKYLQKKNPNALALVNKLRKPSVRSSLVKQTEYWKLILSEEPLRCIFSDKIIERHAMSLDHFLPWSFIGHDQLWNLLPVPSSLNSSKSDYIPDMDKYLDKFIQAQIRGLEVSQEKMTKTKWENTIDDFTIGLNYPFSKFVQLEKCEIADKYEQTILPLTTVAKNMGFHSGWRY